MPRVNLRRSSHAAAITLLLVLMGAGRARAEAPQEPRGWPDFARLFAAETARDGVVGSSVVLVRAGQIVARQDLGLADRDLSQRVDARTLFHWGSITKTLTAIAIMQLV